MGFTLRNCVYLENSCNNYSPYYIILLYSEIKLDYIQSLLMYSGLTSLFPPLNSAFVIGNIKTTQAKSVYLAHNSFFSKQSLHMHI